MKELQQGMMEQFIAACRATGLKVTHQRMEIYRQLLLMPDHPTVEMLHRRLLPALPSISLDTVYRTLATLEEHGLVSRIQTIESQARFEAVSSPHHHLICSDCKQVTDFQWPDADQLPAPPQTERWGDVESRTVVLYGRCRECMEK